VLDPLVLSFWSVCAQLWHVVHDDGDEEDMEEHELAKARKYFDEGVEEMPSDDDEKDNDDEEVVSVGHQHTCFVDFLLARQARRQQRLVDPRWMDNKSTLLATRRATNRCRSWIIERISIVRCTTPASWCTLGRMLRLPRAGVHNQNRCVCARAHVSFRLYPPLGRRTMVHGTRTRPETQKKRKTRTTTTTTR